ncbi:MAG: DMSO/selenate family reductase complex A subunit [Ferrimonas sp.]
MQRRDFLKMSASLGAAAVVTGCSRQAPTPALTAAEIAASEQLNWSSCLVNCGSNCPVRVFSRDINGQQTITRVETDFIREGEKDEYGKDHNVRACLRGRSLRKRTYAHDRLKYPMKRVGPRGSGQFERITWQEAFSTIASELKRLRAEHGPESTHFTYNSGASYSFAGKQCLFRVMNIMGGYMGTYGDYSWAQLYKAAEYTYGSATLGWKGSSNSEMKKSDFVLLIGHNPSEIRMSGSGESYDYLNIIQQKQRARAAGTEQFKCVIIDPRYTDSALGKEDQWVPVRPGTDAALAEAMAYVIITEKRFDQAFLDTYVQGFDGTTMPEGYGFEHSYKAHILDATIDDGSIGENARTPEWAERICGVNADVIRTLAREFASAKTPFVHIAAALSRHASGENNTRACYMLPLLVGAVGRAGTNTGALCTGASFVAPNMPTLGHLSKAKKTISFFSWTAAIEDGKNLTVLRDGVKLPANELDANGDGKLGVDIKAIINYAGNALINQHSDTNETKRILSDDSKCELIVVIDNWMTPSAEWADIVLPDVSWLETEDDLVNQAYAAGDVATLIQMSSAVGPMWECRDGYDIALGLAKEWGVEAEYTEGKTKDEWRAEFYAAAQERAPDLPSKEVMKVQGIYRKYLPNGSVIALEAFRNDPIANKLGTPSGKIEVFSTQLQEMADTWEIAPGDVISAIPKYVPTWDGYQQLDEAGNTAEHQRQFPLQLTGYHTKGRAHSSYHNVPWLREAVQDAIWMNPLDAAERNLQTGDIVHVYNERGTIKLPVKVTPRIMIGVTALGQGAWVKLNEQGIDIGGCLNTVTSQRPTPVAKGNGQHTNRVEIKKA